MKITVLYFARLRELAGTEREQVETSASTLAQFYEQIRARFDFPFPITALRVALNGEFATWDQPLHEGAEVVFVPPVSGG